jgi:uncharacterized protein YyaL (SSP411 family)
MNKMQGSGPVASIEQDELSGDMEDSRKNALERASSGYLRSAMRQPVDWMEWGQAAFDRAAEQDKPILLDIGAVWCHWCHVMDRESYEDVATARIINENFIAVKVDRDERPDVDTRYQAAVSAISGQGGWPLTAFLTPEGKPYFGGTYFPPEDRHGRPSFQRVLLTMAEAFSNRRSEVDESAGSVMEAIEHNESFSGRAGNPGAALVEKMVLAALKSVDMKHGGFGGQPKFPHSSAVDLLIDVASRATGTTVKLAGQGTIGVPDAARRAITLTLDKMARGGVYDQLAGGFHRYSVDEHWTVPHFEKMAYDNCELLKNYVHGYLAFGEERFAGVARDIVRWMDECLSDRAQGGFYASQDADVSLDDDGDFFTWTLDEAAEVLAPAELAVAAEYYDIGEIGDMQHNVSRNVLHVRLGMDAVARKVGVSAEQAQRLLASAKTKMYAARLKRPMPYVDRTIYVGWNALCISAYLEAGRALNMPEARAFAVKSLDRVLREAWTPGVGLCHVVAYGEQESPAGMGNGNDRIAGVLDDYIFLGHAALDAWEATGERRYFDAAAELTQFALDRFYDTDGGAFFDTERVAEGESRLGALGTRRKPLQDSPTPAGNPMAAMLLMRMAELNGRLDYAEKAQETLETFAGVVEHFGLYVATYALALQRMVREPVQVCVIGDDAQAAELEAAALGRYAVNKNVVRLASLQGDDLPEVLATTLPRLPKIEGSYVIVCSGHTCLPPMTTVEELVEALGRSL